MNKKKIIILLLSLLVVISGVFLSKLYVVINTENDVLSHDFEDIPIKEAEKSYSALVHESIKQGNLPAELADDYVAYYEYIVDNAHVIVNGEILEIDDSGISIEDEGYVFNFSSGPYTFYLVYSEKDDQLKDFLFAFADDGFFCKKTQVILDNDEKKVSGDFFDINKKIQVKGGTIYTIRLRMNFLEFFGAGNIKVSSTEDKDTIKIDGLLGTRTYKEIKEILEDDKDVKKIILGDIPGSMNDLINVHTGRLLRENNITTIVTKDSEVHSGGVDLFAAGTERVVYKGAELGVHSWCCKNEVTADKLSQDDSAHASQLSYFTTMLGSDMGRKFYFFTLQAAPFDGIHTMTLDEMKKYNLATKIVE